MVHFKQMMGLFLLKTGQEIVLGQVFAPLLILMTDKAAGNSFPNKSQFFAVLVFVTLLHHFLLEACTP